ncbi:MAG TPA: lysophospholipid acyltransferase family protein [Burkholderiales bacterium]|nr:lysophospholipid acyltransferase family protein [Burkholderiales bacterium]
MSISRTGFLTRAWRLLRMHLLLLRGVFTVLTVYRFADQARRARLLREWSRDLLDVLRVRLTVRGTPPRAPGGRHVVVGNHVSWLDVFVVDAVVPSRFVAKSEIRGWPVIGWLAAQAGTLFIDRSRRHATARTNEQIIAAIAAGDCVAVYPEGTTSDGTRLRHFHASLLQPAVEAGADVHPVVVRYPGPDGRPHPATLFIDNMSFARSVLMILTQREIAAELTFLEPIPAGGRDRRELARLSEQAVASALGVEVVRKEPGTPSGPRA